MGMRVPAAGAAAAAGWLLGLWCMQPSAVWVPAMSRERHRNLDYLLFGFKQYLVSHVLHVCVCLGTMKMIAAPHQHRIYCCTIHVVCSSTSQCVVKHLTEMRAVHSPLAHLRYEKLLAALLACCCQVHPHHRLRMSGSSAALDDSHLKAIAS